MTEANKKSDKRAFDSVGDKVVYQINRVKLEPSEKCSINSEEKYDEPEVNLPWNECKSEQMKIEDLIETVDHDLEYEKLERTECEGCKGSFLGPTDFFNPEGLQPICVCPNGVLGEDMTMDIKPVLGSTADLGITHFKMQEEANSKEKLENFNKNISLRINKKEHFGKCGKISDLKSVPNRNENLLNHTRSHTENLFECETCLKCFNQSSGLKVHQKMCTREASFQDKIYSQPINETNLTAYVQSGKKTSFFKICSKSFSQSSHLKRKSFQPKVCLKSFTENNLKGYEGSHSEKKPFLCSICPKLFSRITHVNRHERSHTGEKLFQCKVCYKSFTENNSLKLHETSHTGEKPFLCKFCPKSFPRNCFLKIHERSHTGEKPFQCMICSKSFSQGSHLKKHIRSHKGEKPFSCKICLKSFVQSENLKSHEIVHTGEKPFSCKICSKSFSQKASLKRHESTHTREKLFQCKVCSRSFTGNNYLKLHERSHSRKNCLQCKTCSKSFTQKSSLKVHERFHTGEKPFSCKICSKSFFQSSYLKIHVRSHTGEKPFHEKFHTGE